MVEIGVEYKKPISIYNLINYIHTGKIENATTKQVES